jgi:hypothetical protein
MNERREYTLFFLKHLTISTIIINHLSPLLGPSLDPRHTKHNFGRGSPKEHLGKAWLKLTKWFQRNSGTCAIRHPSFPTSCTFSIKNHDFTRKKQ